MQKDGRLKGPLYVQFVMGVKNAMPADERIFDFYIETHFAFIYHLIYFEWRKIIFFCHYSNLRIF